MTGLFGNIPFISYIHCLVTTPSATSGSWFKSCSLTILNYMLIEINTQFRFHYAWIVCWIFSLVFINQSKYWPIVCSQWPQVVGFGFQITFRLGHSRLLSKVYLLSNQVVCIRRLSFSNRHPTKPFEKWPVDNRTLFLIFSSKFFM